MGDLLDFYCCRLSGAFVSALRMLKFLKIRESLANSIAHVTHFCKLRHICLKNTDLKNRLMKLKLMISLGLLVVANGLYAQSKGSSAPADKKVVTKKQVAVKPQAATFTSFEDSVAYAYGTMIGGDLKSKGINLKLDMVAKGISSVEGATVLIDEAKAKDLLGRYQKVMMEKMQAEQAVAGGKNLEASNKFLEENKMRPNVVTLPSGLQYEVVTRGDSAGVSPTLSDEVTVNYEGKVISGKVFDSSYERGEPISFELGGVIPGWQEGLQQMKPGDTFILYIPSNLGYGERGAGGSIGPNEALIFKVELISVKKKAPEAEVK